MKKHEKIIESYKNQLLAYRYPEEYQSNPKCREITPEIIEILIKNKYNNYNPNENEIKELFGSKTSYYHIKKAFLDLTAEEDIFGLDPLCDEGLLARNQELETKIKELENQLDQSESRNRELFYEINLEKYRHQCTKHSLEVNSVQSTLGSSLMPTMIHVLNNLGIVTKDDKPNLNEKEMKAIVQFAEYRELILNKIDEMADRQTSYTYEEKRKNDLKLKEIHNVEEKIENEKLRYNLLIDTLPVKIQNAFADFLDEFRDNYEKYDLTEDNAHQLYNEIHSTFCRFFEKITYENMVTLEQIRIQKLIQEEQQQEKSTYRGLKPTPIKTPEEAEREKKIKNTKDSATGRNYPNDGQGNLILQTFSTGETMRKNNLTGEIAFYDSENRKIEN